MDSKYFTPKLEDFIYGYEYEQNFLRYIPKEQLIKMDYPQPVADWVLEDNWVKETFLSDGSPTLASNLERGLIRVPYLTKEDIIAEGWRCIHWREYLWEKENRIIHFFNGQKEDEDDTTYLSIFKIHNSDKILFEGECKDKSAFRYICRLLNI